MDIEGRAQNIAPLHLMRCLIAGYNLVGALQGRAQNIESTEKVGRGAILPFFLQITYGHSQLSIIGGECFFVVGGVRAFGGEALAQVVDFVVVLLKKKGGLFV